MATFDSADAASKAFDHLQVVPSDALLGLIALYQKDDRPEKIDLGVGVFRDDLGATPVMRAVKGAEAVLLRDQSTKSYLGAEGDIRYADLLAEIVFGEELGKSPRLSGVQTPGGTGALRLGAELLKRSLPASTVWIGEPTWPNHGPIFREAGLSVRRHSFYEIEKAEIAFDAMLAELEDAKAGDVLLVHGCCHNPTGATLDTDQWAALAHFCERKAVIPFIDLAYQGLGDCLEADAAAARMMFAALPTALLAYSCDKNFGLYRERVGAFWVQAPNPAADVLVRGNTLALARSLWSMPPDHGAAIVRTILECSELREDWAAELEEMRLRINGLRAALASAHPALAHIKTQRGMFAMLPLQPEVVTDLRTTAGIYMAGNGRINIAGLTQDNIPHFIASLVPHLLLVERKIA